MGTGPTVTTTPTTTTILNNASTTTTTTDLMSKDLRATYITPTTTSTTTAPTIVFSPMNEIFINMLSANVPIQFLDKSIIFAPPQRIFPKANLSTKVQSFGHPQDHGPVYPTD